MENADKTYIAWGIDESVHEAQNLKPMLTPKEQVELLKNKGVTFERCTEEEAVASLTERDSFLHIASYRKLFQKHCDGAGKGQYVRLDFADLISLDSLDARLRNSFLSVAYDIERSTSRRAKLRNKRIQQLLETLVMFERMDCAPSSPYSLSSLRQLKGAMNDIRGEYGDQNAFVSYLGFLARLIDKTL